MKGLSAFAALRDRQGIVLAADLVQADGDVYDDHWHGLSVLSVIAGDLPGRFLGVAPEVDVALVRTEEPITSSSWRRTTGCAEPNFWTAWAATC